MTRPTATDVPQLLKDFDRQTTPAQLIVIAAIYEQQPDLAFQLATHALELWELRRLLAPKAAGPRR